MSILIKGMNMPKDDGLVIAIEPNGEVYVQMQEGFSFFASKTKAAEVPEPHGRLVDADFMKELGAKCIARRCDDGVLLALGGIDDLPTVIEAEE